MWNLGILDTLILRIQYVYGFFEKKLVDGKFKGFPTSHYMQDSITFFISYGIFFFFFSNEGMLSTTIISRIFPKLPKFAQRQLA
jgi:hypothetical protein